jgi:2,4-dienoyl-CoA reductase-like NADH-dependent reductase (Old Yellow Enzyme family)
MSTTDIDHRTELGAEGGPDGSPADIAPLFSPLTIRSLSVPNRFVMAPMTRGFSPDGIPGADVARYYARRAQGGVGLIITEGVGVPHPAAIGESDVDVGEIPVLYGEKALAGWRRVVDEVHAAGGLIAPQLWHQGVMRLDYSKPFPTVPSTRPSGVWGPMGRLSVLSEGFLARVAEPTAPATDEEIADIIAAFGEGAASAREIGFDAIAIHGAHGYLPDSFLWEETNFREDRWGGGIAQRAEFAAELVREIRLRAGEDLPIIFRFSQWKQQDFKARIARTPDELEAVLGPMADAGVDVFDASQRYFDRAEFEGSPMNLAGWARQLTGRRSMAVGGVGLRSGMYESVGQGISSASNNLARVVARFEAEEFDFVALGRALLADPGWVERAQCGAPFLPYDESMRDTLY